MISNTQPVLIEYPLSSLFEIPQELLENIKTSIMNVASLCDKPLLQIRGNQPQEILSQICSAALTSDSVVIFHYNMPLLFPLLTQEVLKRQQEFLVDYTFVEYLPAGVAPFVIRVDILKQILEDESILTQPYHYGWIENYLKQDLNRYDIEVVLGNHDYRYLKQDFIITDKRSCVLFQDILLSHPDFDSFVQKYISYFRVAPTFVEISLHSLAESIFQSPIKIDSMINIPHIHRFLTSLYEQNPTACVQFSLRDGDPLNYPSIQELLSLLAENFSDHEFIIESFGSRAMDYESDLMRLPSLKLVLFLSSASEETQTNIIPSYSLSTQENVVEHFLQKYPERTYIQWVRMLDNEEELPLFLNRWQAYEKNIIISHYTTIGCLPQREVINFSPIKRFPCFYLAKSLFIRPDGLICPCPGDIHHHLLQNMTIQTCNWESLNQTLGNLYQSHYKGEYPATCINCDLWYIYNL